jgi:16S rRNA (guanine527-N7)-methyltransferase
VTGEEERARALLFEAGVDERYVEPLARYARLVLEANAKFNLTGARSAEQLVPHIVDSLTVVPYIKPPYIDIGSGAGLPGIPVAMLTGADTVLLEATAKKAAFLGAALEALHLETARAIVGRAEDAGRDPGLRGFQSATVRAVASAPAALELAAPFLAVGGLAVLQRGAAEPAEGPALGAAAAELGFALEAEAPLKGGRRLLLIRKVGPTPERFPRRSGVAAKRPLGG